MTDGINPEKDYSDEFRRMFFRCRESSMSLIDGLEKLIHDSGIFDRFIIPDNPSLFGHHLSEGVYKSVVDVLSSQYSSLINQGMPQQDAYDNIVNIIFDLRAALVSHTDVSQNPIMISLEDFLQTTQYQTRFEERCRQIVNLDTRHSYLSFFEREFGGTDSSESEFAHAKPGTYHSSSSGRLDRSEMREVATPEICKYRDNLCKEYIRLRKEGIPEEESFNRVIPQFREFFDLTNPNCIDPERENKLKENNLYQLIYSALQTESKRQTGCPEIVYVD